MGEIRGHQSGKSTPFDGSDGPANDGEGSYLGAMLGLAFFFPSPRVIFKRTGCVLPIVRLRRVYRFADKGPVREK